MPSVVTIHDNFRLDNVMFCEEITQISHQCGSSATRNELDTNMIGAHSPFWNKVSSLFNAISACDPNSDGVQKSKAMWSKIKSDYDLAFTNFTKSGNHYSSSW